jgi:hypothetical protein
VITYIYSINYKKLDVNGNSRNTIKSIAMVKGGKVEVLSLASVPKYMLSTGYSETQAITEVLQHIGTWPKNYKTPPGGVHCDLNQRVRFIEL